jgi:hypothetical protein
MALSVQHMDNTADDNSLLTSIIKKVFRPAICWQPYFLRYNDLVFGTCMKYLKDEEASRDAVMDIYQELGTKSSTNIR